VPDGVDLALDVAASGALPELINLVGSTVSPPDCGSEDDGRCKAAGCVTR
jgi:hypothetical protein